MSVAASHENLKMEHGNNTKKRKLRIVKSLKRKSFSKVKMRHNESFVEALSELADIMTRKGEPFRSKAYKSAADSIMQLKIDVTDSNELKDIKHIGKTVLAKLKELQETGHIQVLENERKDPINQLTRIYGIGPKKAVELVSQGVSSIEDLRNNLSLLTTNMKLGVKYFNDIETKIPRAEIDEYKHVINETFEQCAPANSTFEIVGSYRRGKKLSGDIDVIITNSKNDRSVYDKLLDALIKNGTIIETLSRGKTKSMTIARLSENEYTPRCARRIDFLYAPPDEYAFALLYFTGSKAFNTVQRQRALDLGYSLNEHGFYEIKNGKKSVKKLDHHFPTEESIFEFLQMEFREPHERIDARSICPATNAYDPILSSLVAFRKHGKPVLDNLSETELNQIIRKANDTYYGNSVQQLLTDAEYDILCETTAQRFPNNKVVKEGHTTLDVIKNKAKLPFEMWSMDKIKPDTQALDNWKQTYKGPYVLSCKLDGVSGLYVSGKDENTSSKLYTRGNGVIGQDVSHMIPYLNLPNVCDVVLRGEFVISKSTFTSKYADSFSNTRNFVAGAVNQKKIEPDKFGDIDFVCYEVIKPSMKPSEQMAFLSKISANTVQHTAQPVNSQSLTNHSLSNLLQKSRIDCKYDIDGIICYDDNVYPRTKGNPAHAFAFKMMLSHQIAEANVIDVLWTPSKDGYLKPRVHIEPIVLCGARIEYATGFNAKFVKDNNIGTGAIVRIIRSGDVIPHIVEVVEKAVVPGMPDTSYVWNSTNVDILLHDPESDAVVREKNIAGFFRNIGVDGLSIGHTRRIINAGYDTISKIINMEYQDFMKVDGFKERLAEKFSVGIKEKLEQASLAELMHATNIFGRGFGVKRLQAILDAHPDIVTSQVSRDETFSKLNTVSGMATKTSQQFLKNLPKFIHWINSVGLEEKMNTQTKTNTVSKDNPFYGKKYVMTGFRDKSLVDYLSASGAINSSSVSKNTDFVIVKNNNEITGKTKEATALGVTVISHKDLLKIISQ